MLDGRERALAQAAVVRVLPEWIVAVCALEGEGQQEVFLAYRDERLPAVAHAVGEGLAVVEARRGGRELRPFALAEQVELEQPVLVHPLGGGNWPSAIAVQREASYLLEEVDDPAPWIGGIAVRGASLVGVVVGREEGSGPGRPLVRGLQRDLSRCLASVCAAPGSDLLAPGDEFTALEVAVRVPDSLPEVPDDWGRGDLFLALDQRGQETPVARIALLAGQQVSPRTVVLGGLRSLEARLVERDVTLTQGVVDTPLGPPQTLDPRAGAARLRFDLPASAGQPARSTGPATGTLALGLRLRLVDPDRASGIDRTLLGAGTFRFGEAVHGTVSLARGDATDLWCYDPRPKPTSAAAAEAPTPPPGALLLVYRADPARLALEGWHLGAAAPRWRIAPDPSAPRLSALRLDHRAARGDQRHWFRVRQERILTPEAPGLGLPLGYGVAVAPSDDALRQVELLLSLILEEAGRPGAPYLEPEPLARGAFAALRQQGGLEPAAYASALLPHLGHEVPAVRRLVFELLGTHLSPDLVALERLRRDARRDAVRVDAGLLLVERCRGPQGLAELELAWQIERPSEAEPGEDPEAPPEETPLQRRERLVDRTWRALPAAEREALLRSAADDLEEALTRASEDPDPAVRLRAISLAARQADPGIRRRLRQRFEERLHRDPSPRVRRALLTAFWGR